MDTVIFEGVEYIKSATAAKKFRYTNDYIGQLCRAKKVDARLIGRTWFVNPDSLVQHKKTKYANIVSTKKKPMEKKSHTNDLTNKIRITQIKVPPVLRAKTSKIFSDQNYIHNSLQSNPSKKLKIFYELDDEMLIPKLNKKHYHPPKEIRIEQADSKKLKIKKDQKTANFAPTPIPEVSLSGRLKVTALPTQSDEIFEKEKNKKTVPKINDVLKSTEKLVVASSKRDLSKDNFQSDNPHQSTDSRKKLIKILKNNRLNAQMRNNNKPLLLTERPIPLLIRISPLIATVLALLMVLIMLSLVSQVVVNDTEYDSGFELQFENLLN